MVLRSERGPDLSGRCHISHILITMMLCWDCLLVRGDIVSLRSMKSVDRNCGYFLNQSSPAKDLSANQVSHSIHLSDLLNFRYIRLLLA